jgi:hypothetical protein
LSIFCCYHVEDWRRGAIARQLFGRDIAAMTQAGLVLQHPWMCLGEKKPDWKIEPIVLALREKSSWLAFDL